MLIVLILGIFLVGLSIPYYFMKGSHYYSIDQNTKIINLIEEVRYLESKGENDIDVVAIAKKLGFKIINDNIYTHKTNDYLRLSKDNNIVIYLTLDSGINMLEFERKTRLYRMSGNNLMINCDVSVCFAKISRY